MKHVGASEELLAREGAIAQLGERLLCTQEVRSSILLGSTISRWRVKRQRSQKQAACWIIRYSMDSKTLFASGFFNRKSRQMMNLLKVL